MKRKHDAMYAEYGKDYAHTCKQCTNCVYYTRDRDKRYYKCLRYGDSASEATDWAIGKTACGMFDVPLGLGEYPMIKRRRRDAKKAVQVNGQETFLLPIGFECIGGDWVETAE